MKRTAIVGLVALTAFAFVAVGCGSSESSGATGGSSGGGATGSAGTSGASNGGTAGSKQSGGTTSTTSTAAGGTTGATSTSAGGGSSSSTSTACGTTTGTYTEKRTFATAGTTDPFKLNKWGTWGNGTAPTLSQTATGPSGLDCSSGCAVLTMDFSSGTTQYSAGSFVEYFGTSTDAVFNLLGETITVKIALTVTKATGAVSDPPINIILFGQDTFVSTTGVDNSWGDDLGDAASLDAATGWHSVTYQVGDEKVPSWNPTRTVCASGIHALGINVQNNAVIDDTNAAVVTMYVQSVAVAP
jgi:hypothetical protein